MNEQMKYFSICLEHVEKDCKTILSHPINNTDLLNIVLSEDIPELINFARRVSNALETSITATSGDYMKGYLDAIKQLRKEIYGS
jgi:hypothetical protein